MLRKQVVNIYIERTFYSFIYTYTDSFIHPLMLNVTEQVTPSCHPWHFRGVKVKHPAFPKERCQDGCKAIIPFKPSQSPNISEVKSQIHLKFPARPLLFFVRDTAEFSQSIVFKIPVCIQTEKTRDMKGWQFIHLNHSPESNIFNKVFRHRLKKLLKRQNTRGFKVNSTT